MNTYTVAILFNTTDNAFEMKLRELIKTQDQLSKINDCCFRVKLECINADSRYKAYKKILKLLKKHEITNSTIEIGVY